MMNTDDLNPSAGWAHVKLPASRYVPDLRPFDYMLASSVPVLLFVAVRAAQRAWRAR